MGNQPVIALIGGDLLANCALVCNGTKPNVLHSGSLRLCSCVCAGKLCEISSISISSRELVAQMG